MRRVVWGTSLYSYLVTRHTGRAVRLSIENQIAECEGQVVAVLDFQNVVVIDFSCADEVVAKLAHLAPVHREPWRLAGWSQMLLDLVQQTHAILMTGNQQLTVQTLAGNFALCWRIQVHVCQATGWNR